jgi:hypothetical protein
MSKEKIVGTQNIEIRWMGKVVLSYHTQNLKPIISDYIYQKNRKGKPREKDLPLWEDDITKLLVP